METSAAAKAAASSPGKPTRKAVTPAPCTTSSTTAHVEVVPPPLPETAETSTAEPLRLRRPGADAVVPPTPADAASPETLTDDRLEAVRRLILNGASPAGACRQLGISLDAYLAANDADAEVFERRLRDQETLSQNVAAALYRSAMKGSVPAQTFYLRSLPPPEWIAAEKRRSALADNSLDDDQLVDRCLTREMPGLAEEMGKDGPPPDAPQSA